MDFTSLAAKAKRRLKRTPDVHIARRAVQFLVALMLIVAAWNFFHFVVYLRSDALGPAPIRPPVAEGFLPIAAIVALKAYLATGTIDPIHPAGLVVFLATLVTAWLFRRALCSWICPLGTLSEQLANLGKKLFGRNLGVPRWLDMILLSLKYVVAAYLLSTFILLPAAVAIDFMRIPYYSISDIKMFEMFMKLNTTGLAVIGALVLFSIPVRSFWCRYLCPYGALLGILGLVSPVIISKDDESCTKCGLCNKACPNGVDVERKGSYVISPECTGCGGCIAVCPKKGTLSFKILGMLPATPLAFGAMFAIVFFSIVAMAQATGHWETVLTIDQYKALVKLMP
ncbi:MAG: 4Fe-4S binding protein [Candidatus Aquicultorales bacterium]